MDVKQFKEGVELMSYSGFKLTEMEAALIENSLIILQSANKFKDVYFFGRFETNSAVRYYVAFGYYKDVLKDRKFFYSLNGHEWFMLPECQPKLLPIAMKVSKSFQGDPAHVERVAMNPTFVADVDEVFVQCPSAIKKIKEEDRLSCIVQKLVNESAMVPRGALCLQNGSIAFNPRFRGLSRLDASQVKNFQLFRFPINDRNRNLMKREDYNYKMDFMDTIDDLVPAKSFTLKVNDQDVCLIRSLKWPGMIFYHKLNTMYKGFFYFGDGTENLDLLFMTSN